MVDNRTRITLVDPNDTSLKVSEIMINQFDKYRIVSFYNNLETAFENIEIDRPNLLIVNPIETDVNDYHLLKSMIVKLDSLEILIYSELMEKWKVIALFNNGASGYIIKNEDEHYKNLIRAIEHLHVDGTPLSPRISKILIDSYKRNTDTPLSKREMEVLAQISIGKSYPKIAQSMALGSETIKSHVKSIYSKLQVHKKHEAIAHARRHQWI